MVIFFETHRHIGHIEREIFLKTISILKNKYAFLCVLCAYVFQKKITMLLFFTPYLFLSFF
jgi:hypothetical protein